MSTHLRAKKFLPAAMQLLLDAYALVNGKSKYVTYNPDSYAVVRVALELARQADRP